MIRECKYVIVSCSTGMEIPVLIPMAMGHGEMSHENIVSAGFCSIKRDGKVSCYGKSASLDKDSRGEDDEYLIKCFFFTREK